MALTTPSRGWESASPSQAERKCETYLEIEKMVKTRGFVIGTQRDSDADAELLASAMLDLLPLNHLHHYFLHIFTTQFALVKSLSGECEKAEAEKLAKTMTNILAVYGADEPLDAAVGSAWNATSVRLLLFLLKGEFSAKAASDPGAILRGNDLISRLMTNMSSDALLTNYLQQTVGSIVKEIVENNIALEIDPTKIKLPDAEAKAKMNVVELASLCERLLKKLSDQNNMAGLHRAVRAMASFIREMAQQYTPQKVSTFIGGFVMLRLVNPSIINPKSVGLGSTTVSGPIFRTLTLITKVLQNLANGVLFGKKEPYMIPMNIFIEAKKDEMISFLNKFSSDPKQQEGKEPWEDYKNKALLHKKIGPPETVSKVKLTDLVFLQYQFHAQKEKIYPSLGKDVPSKELFFWILDEMGAPLDPNLKTVTFDDLEKQRTVRKFVTSLEKFTLENLINQEILKEEGGKILKKEDDRQKELKKAIKDHQFATLMELTEKLSHPLLGVSLKEDKTFSAAEAVDWLYSNLALKSRSQAVQLASQLAQNQLILPSTKKLNQRSGFKDRNKQWKFQPPEEIALLRKKLKAELGTKSSEKDKGKPKVPVFPSPLTRSGSFFTKTGDTELTERDWQLLLIGAEIRVFAVGDAIVREGRSNQHLYRIKSGMAIVNKKQPGGNEKQIGVVGPGAMLCEMSVIDKEGVTSATIVASSAVVEVCVIDVSFVYSLFGVEPDLSKRFYKFLAFTIARRMNKSKEGADSIAVEKLISGSMKENLLLQEFQCSTKKTLLTENITLSILRNALRLQFKKEVVNLTWYSIQNMSLKKEKLQMNIKSLDKKSFHILFRSTKELDEAWLVATKLWKSASETKKEKQFQRASLVSSGASLARAAKQSEAEEARKASEEKNCLFKKEVLDTSDWERILLGARSVVFKPNRPIIRQGQTQPSIYVINRGRCRVELNTDDTFSEEGNKSSTSKVVAFLEKGQMFGELSFLLGGKSTASVLAHENEVEVQIIEDAYLNILFVRQPALAGRFYHYLASLLATRIKESEKRLVTPPSDQK